LPRPEDFAVVVREFASVPDRDASILTRCRLPTARLTALARGGFYILPCFEANLDGRCHELNSPGEKVGRASRSVLEWWTKKVFQWKEAVTMSDSAPTFRNQKNAGAVIQRAAS